MAANVIEGVHLDGVNGDIVEASLLLKSIQSKALKLSNLQLDRELTLIVVQCLKSSVKKLVLGRRDGPVTLHQTFKKYNGRGMCHEIQCYSDTRRDPDNYMEFIQQLKTWATHVKWETEDCRYMIIFKRNESWHPCFGVIMNHIFDHPLINTKNHESNQNTKSNALHEEATQEKKLPDGIVDNPEAQSNVNVTQSTYGHHNTSAGGNHVHGDVNYNFYNHNPLSAEHLTPPAIAERPQSSHSATPPSKVPCVSPLAVC